MLARKYNTPFILKISFISALGGYLFGFDFAVIAGALPFLQKQFQLNSYWEGFATGVLALGAIAGCITAGTVAEKHGRRKGLLLAALIFAVSSIAMGLSAGRFYFLIARFVAGIGVGMASMLSPMYIAEVSPAHVRGRMVALNQLTIVLGILITNLVNFYLRNLGDDAWRWMFGLGAIPAALFFAGAIFLPESPRWLVKYGKANEAKKVLSLIGDENFIDETINNISNSLDNTHRKSFSGLFSKNVYALLLIGIGLAVFQQFCGINTVFNYAPKIFESIGATQESQLLETVFIGGVNVIFTVISMFLVDKIGRKPLILLGAAGLSVLYIIIVTLLGQGSSNVSWVLLSAIAVYAMTLAPVTWVLISEIFPTSIRGTATTIAVVALWLAYFILVFTFPLIFEKLKDQTFYIYSAVCAIGFVFILMKIKETRGKTLEEVEASLLRH